MMVAFLSPHVIWFARIGELDSLDLLTGDSQTFNIGGTMVGIFDGKIYSHQSYNDVTRFDPGGNPEMQLPGLVSGRRGHWLGRSPF